MFHMVLNTSNCENNNRFNIFWKNIVFRNLMKFFKVLPKEK